MSGMKVEERFTPYTVEASLHMPLGEVCKTTSGGTPSRKNPDFFSGSIPWVKSGELPDGPVVEIEESISEEALRQSSAKLFPAGTLLIALYGATVGKLGILTRPAATNQAVCAIFPPPDIDARFLFWFLRFKRSDLVAQAVGGAQPNISQGIIRALEVPLLPLDQQKRIVAEIEKQFSRLDEAVANLKRVKANLKRYKAAVLKAAVEGRLVEREAEIAKREGRSFETGEHLLQRILDERREKWTGRGKYKEPAAPDTTDLPELPEGWVWASLDQMTGDSLIGLDRGRDQQNSEGIGTPYVKMNNVTMGGEVTSEGMVYVDASSEEKKRFNLQVGDLLFNTRNSKELVGKVGIVRNLPSGAIYNNNLMRMRTVNGAMPTFICSQMCADGFRRRMELVKKATTNVAAVYARDLFPLSLALPPLAEQHRIVAEVDRRLSVIKETEAQVDANLQRAERLRQSILTGAFSDGVHLSKVMSSVAAVSTI